MLGLELYQTESGSPVNKIIPQHPQSPEGPHSPVRRMGIGLFQLLHHPVQKFPLRIRGKELREPSPCYSPRESPAAIPEKPDP